METGRREKHTAESHLHAGQTLAAALGQAPGSDQPFKDAPDSLTVPSFLRKASGTGRVTHSPVSLSLHKAGGRVLTAEGRWEEEPELAEGQTLPLAVQLTGASAFSSVEWA